MHVQTVDSGGREGACAVEASRLVVGALERIVEAQLINPQLPPRVLFVFAAGLGYTVVAMVCVVWWTLKSLKR